MRGNHEKLLVAQNTATCTGDKSGDGEAIAYDGNHNWNGLPEAQAVTAATSKTVTAAEPLLSKLGTLALPGNYYWNFWVKVADGPGKGQVRKIVSYPLDGSGAPVTPITFTVSPAWDVIPQSTGRITVAKQFWQTYTVDNVIDQRQPLCTKLNPNKPSGGVITLYSQTADSAVEGNVQHDTNGIVLAHVYTVPDSSFNPPLGSATGFQSFVEVRGNTVDHEYQWDSDCSWSGVQAWYGAGPTAGSSPPTEGYGVSISHNSITKADGIHGGAIVLAPTWYEGPTPTNWNLIESPLIFGNTISDVNGPPAGAFPPYASCNTGNNRCGINVADSHVFHAVLSSNTCTNVSTPLHELGTNSVRICSATTT